MNLDRPDEREVLIARLVRKSDNELEALLADLYKRRYIDYEIEIDEEYRVTSHVYLSRNRTGNSLIFHLKKFLGIVGYLIISSYLYINN